MEIPSFLECLTSLEEVDQKNLSIYVAGAEGLTAKFKSDT